MSISIRVVDETDGALEWMTRIEEPIPALRALATTPNRIVTTRVGAGSCGSNGLLAKPIGYPTLRSDIYTRLLLLERRP